MRILLITHAPLEPEYGAAQAAQNLANGLRERGHTVVLRTTEPLPTDARWWNVWRYQRRRVEELLAQEAPVDAVDLPALLVSRQVASRASVIVRSVQPELLYFRDGLRAMTARRPAAPLHWLLNTIVILRQTAAVLAGWRRAALILCQGSRERNWMAEAFPFTRSRLGIYYNAPSPADQETLRRIRAHRRARQGAGVRFLWIGRWASHKGTDVLLRWLRERAISSPHDRLTLAGTGESARADCPEELLVSGRLQLIPTFQRDRLPELLREHDAGLFTSTVEGWGLCLNEMLESGLPVFATEAGGACDLAPFFARGLRPFPPPAEVAVEPPGDDLEANGYYQRFSWPAIAAAYEAAVISRLRSPRQRLNRQALSAPGGDE